MYNSQLGGALSHFRCGLRLMFAFAAVCFAASSYGLSYYVANNGYLPDEGPAGVYVLNSDGAITSMITSPLLVRPNALAQDADGNLYVTNINSEGDFQNTIIKITTTGMSVFVPSDGGLDFPIGMAFNSTGVLYVANRDTNTISAVAADGAVSTFATTGVILDSPRGLVFDSQDNLYVANQANNTVLKIAPNGALLATYENDDYLLSPQTLTIDSQDNLYVGVEGNLVSNYGVTQITLDGTISPFGVLDETAPTGMTFDGEGNLLVNTFFDGTTHMFSASGEALPDFATGLNTPWSIISTSLPLVVPEPSAAALIVVGLGVLVFMRRRGLDATKTP